MIIELAKVSYTAGRRPDLEDRVGSQKHCRELVGR
jgi:hypothetical protein